MITISAISNPFSTGSGGATFEQLVGTYYLVSLLAGEIPRGLDKGIIQKVMFQQRCDGFLLDDIIITSSFKGSNRRLALQVKHDMTFSDAPSNELFANIIAECWKTFKGLSGWEFNPEEDRLGIGLGVYQKKVAEHFQQLLEWARVASNSDEFLRKIRLPSFSSKEKRDYLEIIKKLLNQAKESEVTNDELWEFLKCLVVMHFDLEYSGSRDTLYCWNRLLDLLKDRDEGKAKALFNKLTSIVTKYARSAGTIKVVELRAQISDIPLKDQPNYSSDLENLRKHSDMVLLNIRDSIGEKVRFPRNKILDQLKESIKRNEVVIAFGEPMVGKSVILRLLATILRSEGEIIAFSIDRLSGNTIETFLHNINIKTDFYTILNAIGNAPFRCILIDGLERVLLDEDKRRVVNDLFLTTRECNRLFREIGGPEEYCWKIVCSCRELELYNVLHQLETRLNLTNETIGYVKVEVLTEKETQEIADQFPILKSLISDSHLKEIVSLPLILDKLTLPDIRFPKNVPSRLTESWLFSWFWKEIVRLGERKTVGRGSPDIRDLLMIDAANQLLDEKKLTLNRDDETIEAANGLVSDCLLKRINDHFEFFHDIFEDWTLMVLLKKKREELITFLTGKDENLRLAKAFRLYSIMLLEVETAPNSWLELLIELENFEKEGRISPRWYQLTLSAPLYSPILGEIISFIKDYLLENNTSLLNKLLKALRTNCIQPNPQMYALYSGLPQEKLEKYIVYTSDPIRSKWVPLIRFCLDNIDKLDDSCLLEFSIISEKWMMRTEGKGLLREEIVKISLEIINSRFLKRDSTTKSHTSLGNDEEKILRENLLKSVLWGADCLSGEVEDFIKQKALRNPEMDYYDFEDLLLREDGMIPICKYLPSMAVDIFKGILCEKLEIKRSRNTIHLITDLGIRYTLWSPPTYFKGPFLMLLRFHPDEGLDLIHQITNHATQCWKMIEEQEREVNPLPQIIQLDGDEIKVWGNEFVYHWYRYPNVGSSTVTCALMALEYWMNEQIKKNSNPVELFERIFQNTRSAAIIGVCVSVALANWKKCIEAIIPILENPAFWYMDIKRRASDMTAESFISLVIIDGFSLTRDEHDNKILLKLAKQPHRKSDISWFIPNFLFNRSEVTKTRIQNAVRSFPSNPPYFYENERKDTTLIRERIKTCKIWAALVELENYKKSRTEDGNQFEFILPEELINKEEMKYYKRKTKLSSFLAWSLEFRDKGEIGNNFSLETAIEYTQYLESNDNPLFQPESVLEDSEERAYALAAFTAALIIHQWEWIEKRNYHSWCKKQLIIAVTRSEPSEKVSAGATTFSMGYKRSAALALPSYLSKFPHDIRIRRLIEGLALHNNNEIRMYLFSGLRVLWPTDQSTIWKCIALSIKSSKYKVVDYRFWYFGKQSQFNISKQKSIPDIVLNTILRAQIKLSSLFKPLSVDTRSLTTESAQILAGNLSPILYCLPAWDETTDISLEKIIKFLENLLIFTISAYILFQKDNRDYNKWAFNNWNRVYFKVLIKLIFQFSKDVNDSKFITPILDNWEKAPALMEEFLRNLLLIGSNPKFEDKFIEIWLKVGNHILCSKKCKSIECFSYLTDHLENVLRILIFDDRTSIWKVEEWRTLNKMTEFISHWCEIVGHNIKCFTSLVVLLQTVGSFLMPEFGINWLHSCINKNDNINDFLRRSKITSSLSGLLSDSWIKYEDSIRSEQERFEKFAFIVDELAKQNNSIAINLQSKLFNLRHPRVI